VPSSGAPSADTSIDLLERRPWGWLLTPVSLSVLSHTYSHTHNIAVVVGTLSALAFTVLLFFSSFITTYLISGPSNSSSGFVVYPWEIFREIIRSVVCALTDVGCEDDVLSFMSNKQYSPPRFRDPERPPSLLYRFGRRLLLGIPTVGAGSLFSIIWNLPFPLTHWIRGRLRRSNRNSSDFTTLIFVGLVLIGALKCVLLHMLVRVPA
jgi:hypothetical protein